MDFLCDLDPGEVALREQAMMTSREKWQTELDEKANEWNVKKKEVSLWTVVTAHIFLIHSILSLHLVYDF